MPDAELVRVFVPTTTSGLAEAVARGALPGGPAFAVTPGLREWYADADGEELEYVAMTSAAQAALHLIDADASARRRRVVVAVDVAADQVSSSGDVDDRDAVVLRQPVPLAQWRAAHVDSAEAEADVARAAENVVAADLGSEPSQEAVDDALGHELMWFAVQELAAWLDLLDLES